MSISSLVVWFALAAVAGWLFESAYSIIRTGHWEKRGFLFGPLCPIYGVGVAAAILLFDRPEVADGTFPAWAVFLASMAGSAVMEYTVSLALEKLFGAVWWDYSNMPLNVHGRICLPASLLFGAAGVAVVYLLLPLIHTVYLLVPSIAFEVLALGIVFLVAADLTATIFSLSDLMRKITDFDEAFNTRADERVQQTSSAIRALPDQLGQLGQQTLQQTLQQTSQQRERMLQTLTKHQVRLLGQLRRFSSIDLRAKTESLRETLKTLSPRDWRR